MVFRWICTNFWSTFQFLKGPKNIDIYIYIYVTRCLWGADGFWNSFCGDTTEKQFGYLVVEDLITKTNFLKGNLTIKHLQLQCAPVNSALNTRNPSNPLKSLSRNPTYLEKATTNCKNWLNWLKEPSSLNETYVLMSVHVQALFYMISYWCHIVMSNRGKWHHNYLITLYSHWSFLPPLHHIPTIWLPLLMYSHDLMILMCFEYPDPESKNITPGLIFPLPYLAGTSMCLTPLIQHSPENIL